MAMTETQNQERPDAAHRASNRSNPLLAVLAAIAAWCVPGLGHLILRRWVKAAVYFVVVGSLAMAGLLMRGNVFTSDWADAFEMLGFLADVGSGVFYVLSQTLNLPPPDVSTAAGDHGTRLIATAGVLNFLFVLEAFEIGLRRREREDA
jgi:hypothetical protein